MAFKLARQGLNVAIVALGDQLLDNTYEELCSAFPKLQFRKVLVSCHKSTSGYRLHVAILHAACMLIRPCLRTTGQDACHLKSA